MKAIQKIATIWNTRGITRDFFVEDEIISQLFDFSKPIKLDDASFLMIEDVNGVGHRPSYEVYSKLLNQSYDVIDYNPITNLVRFALHTGEIASNNIICFKSNYNG